MRVGEDGIVTITCHRSEMGQGIRTTMPMIIADEMEADWAKCRVEQADGDEPKYGSQNTDGSTSVRDFLDKYREAGATTVRALLEDAAAKEWGVAPSEVTARNGEVVHGATRADQGVRRAGRDRADHRHAGRLARCTSRRPPSGGGKGRASRRSTSCR